MCLSEGRESKRVGGREILGKWRNVYVVSQSMCHMYVSWIMPVAHIIFSYIKFKMVEF